MYLVRGTPHPALRGAVTRYADFAEQTGSPTESGEMPGPSLVVIVDLEAGWTVEGESFGSFVGGLYARPVRVRHEGSARGVQLDLEPLAARALLGVPGGELAQSTASLDDLLGPEASEIAERLHEATGAAARFSILDGALRQRLNASRFSVAPDAMRAWSLLRASGGRIRIDRLARTLGCSRRHLTKRFAEDVGAPPKVAARLMRFEAARTRLGTMPLADLAADHGYSDQAHLAREFRALGGAPPTEFPFVQDGDAAAA